jgi:hypothetical protein
MSKTQPAAAYLVFNATGNNGLNLLKHEGGKIKKLGARKNNLINFSNCTSSVNLIRFETKADGRKSVLPEEYTEKKRFALNFKFLA